MRRRGFRGFELISLLLLSFLLALLSPSFSFTDNYGDKVSLKVKANPTTVRKGEILSIEVDLKFQSPSNNDAVIYEDEVKLEGRDKLVSKGFQIIGLTRNRFFFSTNNYDVYTLKVKYQVVATAPGVYPLNFFKVRYKVHLKDGRVKEFLVSPDSFDTVKVLSAPKPNKPAPSPSLNPPSSQSGNSSTSERKEGWGCPKGISPSLCIFLKVSIVIGLLLLLLLLLWWVWSSGTKEDLNPEKVVFQQTSASSRKLPRKEEAREYYTRLLKAYRFISSHISPALEGMRGEFAENFDGLKDKLDRSLQLAEEGLKGVIVALSGEKADPSSLSIREVMALLHDLQGIDYKQQERIIKVLERLQTLRYSPPEYRREPSNWRTLIAELKEVISLPVFSDLKGEE